MAAHFHVLDVEKRKDGKFHVKGNILLDAQFTLDPDDDDDDGGSDGGGGGGGGGGRRPLPDIKIDLRERDDVKWIYGSGTPGWAIAAAESAGYETVHIDDLPRNYPWK